jgi:hypothetical protein
LVPSRCDANIMLWIVIEKKTTQTINVSRVLDAQFFKMTTSYKNLWFGEALMKEDDRSQKGEAHATSNQSEEKIKNVSTTLLLLPLLL